MELVRKYSNIKIQMAFILLISIFLLLIPKSSIAQGQLFTVERFHDSNAIENLPTGVNKVYWEDMTTFYGDDQGNVYATGRNDCGQIGDPVVIGSNVNGVTQINGITNVERLTHMADSGVVVALKDDGTVWTWGCSDYLGRSSNNPSYDAIPTQLGQLPLIVDFDSSSAHTLLLSDTGLVYAWGRDTCAQLGNHTSTIPYCGYGDDLNLYVPSQMQDIDNIIDIAAGSPWASYFLKSDGTVLELGSRYIVESFANTFPVQTSPILIPDLQNVTKIDSGIGSGFALTTDGNVYGWGVESWGTLGGNAQSTPKKDGQFYTQTPILLNQTPVFDIFAGGWMIAMKTSQGVIIQGGGIDGVSEANRYLPYLIPNTQNISNEYVSEGSKFFFLNSTPLELTTEFISDADTYIRSGQSNKNEGGSSYMQIQSSGQNRALVRFNQAALQSAIGSKTVTSAKLQLTITDNGDNWGAAGRSVDIYRLLSDWVEGNGNDNSRGTGAGATWACATDSNIQNQAKDCSSTTEWEMGQPNNPSVHPWAQSPTATQTIANNQSGVVEYDVTSDVVAFMNGSADNYGWLVKKTNEGQNGMVSFGTKESNFPAKLVVTYQ